MLKSLWILAAPLRLFLLVNMILAMVWLFFPLRYLFFN
ncbi:Hypothetical protein EAG7_01654 [Klebsiella aerogenes]|nr:Hypothetical protein EAG7_01654 [Klebsiella aerogenes]CCG30129.1 hypothetical protein [Klebsiella aerogenes EA1509E]